MSECGIVSASQVFQRRSRQDFHGQRGALFCRCAKPAAVFHLQKDRHPSPVTRHSGPIDAVIILQLAQRLPLLVPAAAIGLMFSFHCTADARGIPSLRCTLSSASAHSSSPSTHKLQHDKAAISFSLAFPIVLKGMKTLMRIKVGECKADLLQNADRVHG